MNIKNYDKRWKRNNLHKQMRSSDYKILRIFGFTTEEATRYRDWRSNKIFLLINQRYEKNI